MGKLDIRRIAWAFTVGGAYAVVGQLLLVAYTAVLGADSPFLMAAVLLSLGVVAFVLYVPGIHQKIEEKSGYGSMLPFNGFACGIAGAYEGGGIAAALGLVAFVMGIGSVAVILVAVVASFV
ncbi:MAG: SpoVA/SpoVAEb family sporulation membrane protein [Eggerthellaceae bacterium]|nr:SpoVA/SpoVAEb family sporulation membrane protein [Eggerthellaceae bacterium]